MKQALVIGCVALLAGCGGGGGNRLPPGTVPIASGPISNACMASNRKARSHRLCGCIQAAADQTLSRSEQRRAVTFYSDPHSAQEIRQSDRPADERFWLAYKAYGERAERLCR